MPTESSVASYEHRLAKAVLAGGADAERSAVTLFELHGPRNRTQAINLVVPFGPVPSGTFDCISRAYDIYRHACDMPCD